MARLKNEGIFLKSRTTKSWTVTIDGEEFKFHKKGLAVLGAKAARDAGHEVRLIEVTKHVVYGSQIDPKQCKIDFWETDITHQIVEH